MAEPDPKVYLEYLDKEMTIMGILSTFCVLVIGLTVNGSLGAEKGEIKNLWVFGQWYVLGGSLWMLVAALFFYRQRSLLAYYYGQISLCHVKGSSGEFDDVESALLDADAWVTWFFYQCAFASMIVGFVAYGLALVSLTVPLVRGAAGAFALSLVSGGGLACFAWWNHRRLSAIDEDPKEHHRAGWLAKPSRAVRGRKKRPATRE
jgi:hypothetical protein